jgi:hypothetical protein
MEKEKFFEHAKASAERCVAAAIGTRDVDGEEAAGIAAYIMAYTETVGMGARVEAITTVRCMTVKMHVTVTAAAVERVLAPSLAALVGRQEYTTAFEELRRRTTGSEDSPVTCSRWADLWRGFLVAWWKTMLVSDEWKADMGTGWKLRGTPAVSSWGVWQSTLVKGDVDAGTEERMTILAAIVQEPGKGKDECGRERQCKRRAYELLRFAHWPVICVLFNIGRWNNRGS